MIRNVLESINGVETFPLLSLVLFASIFTYVLVKVFTADKKHIDKMANLPLEETKGDLNK